MLDDVENTLSKAELSIESYNVYKRVKPTQNDHLKSLWDLYRRGGIYKFLDRQSPRNVNSMSTGIPPVFLGEGEWDYPGMWSRNLSSYSIEELHALIYQLKQGIRLTRYAIIFTIGAMSVIDNIIRIDKRVLEYDNIDTYLRDFDPSENTECTLKWDLQWMTKHMADMRAKLGNNLRVLKNGYEQLKEMERYTSNHSLDPHYIQKGYAMFILNNLHLDQYKFQIQMHFDCISHMRTILGLKPLLTMGIRIPTGSAAIQYEYKSLIKSHFEKTNNSKPILDPKKWNIERGTESYIEGGGDIMEGDRMMNNQKLTNAQEGFLADFIDKDEIASMAIIEGATILPMLLLSPMLSRIGKGEPALFREKDYENSLVGLRSIFGKYVGSHAGFVGHNVEKKIRKAFTVFKSNKNPIYVNAVMWDTVKDFNKRYEWVFDNIKALLTDYKENIGPKSDAKFEFEKNEEAFDLANEWLEKYLAILDDMNDMVRWVLKDVNSPEFTPVSPDIKVSEKEFFEVCDADICVNFKKTFKANKVLGHIKKRKEPANKSMKENFESAIKYLCKGYMYYVCYIFMMCSEAYRKEENQKND